MVLPECEQLVRRRKHVGHANEGVRAGRFAVDDDLAIAGREIEARGERFASRVARGEAHRVAVVRERLVDMEDDVRRRVERDAFGAVEGQLALGPDARGAPGERAGIDRVRSLAAQSGHDRAIGAVVASRACD